MQFPIRITLVVFCILIFSVSLCTHYFAFNTISPDGDSTERDLLSTMVHLEEKVSFYKSEILRMRMHFSSYQKEFGNTQFSIVNALPHLLDVGPEAMKPSVVVGNPRPDPVMMVIGVPTVRRPTQSYLLPTLHNLVNSMTPAEKNETIIIVMIAEVDSSFVEATVNSISSQFGKELKSGLMEIVAPSSSYYPDLKHLDGTLGDGPDRTRWRTKQNLDYVFLMMYAQGRGTYYLQLEDDVLTKSGFVSTIMNFALRTSLKTPDWFMLDFCQLGFIGKLFRTADLWQLVHFILLFYRDKPGDWLLSHFFSVKYCKLDDNHKKCLRVLSKHWIHLKPSIFQHIGMVSSLTGKTQKLKDKQFGKLQLFKGHRNPEALVDTSIKHYAKYTLQKAYMGHGFFWGLSPSAGDVIHFKFHRPVNLLSYRFVSGNAEHPSDIILNGTLEALPSRKSLSEPRSSQDAYVNLGEFDGSGILSGNVPKYLNPVAALKITIQQSSNNWIILSEIQLTRAPS